MKVEVIEPFSFVATRLPNDTHTITEVKPNTSIQLGKYGQFQANQILGRPYYLTFEIIDENDGLNDANHGLRLVSAAELHATSLEDDTSTPAASDSGELLRNGETSQYEVVGEDGKVVMRTNQHIIDDSSSQIMTMDEIEAFKASNPGSGKDLIAKIIESHSALDQKTAFALAKYTLRKTRKYIRRFTVLPLDVSILAKWSLFEKEAGKVMEMREEILSLIRSWSNIHFTPEMDRLTPLQHATTHTGKWLLVDETAGLLTAYMAENMGLLHPDREQSRPSSCRPPEPEEDGQGVQITPEPAHDNLDNVCDTEATGNQPSSKTFSRHPPPSHSNTLTVLHSLSQPNLSFLNYFHFDYNNPSPLHPLTTHLRTLSWLQLLEPSADTGYREPPPVSDSELATYKPNKRGTYYRKRRRWAKIKHTVDSTRAGGFDGLIIASVMHPHSVLEHLVPLVRGGGQVVVYAPHVEPLAELVDLYSTARRTAFINSPEPSKEDFPLDPRLLLAPTIYTARAKAWQVLPGRTHPLMTGRGGADGFVFTATKVIPAEGRVEARGNFAKRRKVVGLGKADGLEVKGENDADIMKQETEMAEELDR